MQRRLTCDEFDKALKDISFSVIEGVTFSPKMSTDEGISSHYQGTVAFTHGLTEILGYELVSYGQPDPEDTYLSAKLLHSISISQRYINGEAEIFAIEIPRELLSEIDANIFSKEDVTYKQAVTLEDYVDGQPIHWMADGGLPLLPEKEFEEKILVELRQHVLSDQDRMESMREQSRAFIEKSGYTKIGVYDPMGNTPTFVYTVGLTKSGLPELLIGGNFDPEFLSSTLDHFARRLLKDPTNFSEERNAFETETTGYHHIKPVAVDTNIAVSVYLLQASAVMGIPVTQVFQVQMSDINGFYPDDHGFENIFTQPVIPRPR